MSEQLLTVSPWFSLAAGTILLLLDAWLSLRVIYVYHQGARDVIRMPGQFELLHPFEPKRGIFQLFDRRLFLFLAGGISSIILAWYVIVIRAQLPAVFVFLMGALLLFEFAECARQVRQLTVFRAGLTTDGLLGEVTVPRWLSASLFAVDMYSYALLYILIFLATSSIFFLGGAVHCVIRAHGTGDFAVYLKLLKRKGRA